MVGSEAYSWFTNCATSMDISLTETFKGHQKGVYGSHGPVATSMVVAMASAQVHSWEMFVGTWKTMCLVSRAGSQREQLDPGVFSFPCLLRCAYDPPS